MLSIGTIVMGAADEGRAADFWSQALDYVPRDALVGDDWGGAGVGADGRLVHFLGSSDP